MHICIPLYIHITVLYYILASFQKINVNVNVKRTLKKIKSKHSIKKKKSISESLLILAGTITATVPARVEKRLI